MVRFQNRRNRTRWTSDVFWIMRSAIGTLPGLAKFLVGHKQPRTTQWRQVPTTSKAYSDNILSELKFVQLTIVNFNGFHLKKT